MNNKVVSFSSLTGDLKKAFINWVNLKSPNLISFPYNGKHMKGYLFDYESCKYVVIMYLFNDTTRNLNLARISS
jgi:hypothetical protein